MKIHGSESKCKTSKKLLLSKHKFKASNNEIDNYIKLLDKMSGQQKLLTFAESEKGLEQLEKIMDKIRIRIFFTQQISASK